MADDVSVFDSGRVGWDNFDSIAVIGQGVYAELSREYGSLKFIAQTDRDPTGAHRRFDESRSVDASETIRYLQERPVSSADTDLDDTDLDEPGRAQSVVSRPTVECA